MRIQSCISTPQFENAVKRVGEKPYSDIKSRVEGSAIRLIREYTAQTNTRKRSSRVGSIPSLKNLR